MAADSEYIKIVKTLILEIKACISNLEKTHDISFAQELMQRKKQFSAISKELSAPPREIDTLQLKYLADAIAPGAVNMIISVSENHYNNRVIHEYKRWLSELKRKFHHDIASELTKSLHVQYHRYLTTEFKEMCKMHVQPIESNKLHEHDKAILDEFIKRGCELLRSIYTDFEITLLRQLSGSV